MELSEAKRMLKDITEKGYYISPAEYPAETARAGIEAIDTVLKALDEDELIIDRVKNIKDRLAYDITYNWDNALDDLQRMLGV